MMYSMWMMHSMLTCLCTVYNRVIVITASVNIHIDTTNKWSQPNAWMSEVTLDKLKAMKPTHKWMEGIETMNGLKLKEQNLILHWMCWATWKEHVSKSKECNMHTVHTQTHIKHNALNTYWMHRLGWCKINKHLVELTSQARVYVRENVLGLSA